MSSRLLERMKFINGLAPSADMHTADPASDVVSMKHYDRMLFVVYGVSTTGTMTITVEECDDFTPTTSTAIPFAYAQNLSADSGDTFTAQAEASASGITTEAGDTFIYLIEVKAAALSDGFPNVRVQLTEGVDAATVGCVLAIGGDSKYYGDSDTLPTAIA